MLTHDSNRQTGTTIAYFGMICKQAAPEKPKPAAPAKNKGMHSQQEKGERARVGTNEWSPPINALSPRRYR